ncbi:AraC family ligand binding domain-containing protein [Paenibacillus sp. MER TA 81-3]|uniref:cupin domain-containing protein n=1 Tax=Paenibacillus sp. MER TA 81-3 TaxID=2939573 RepID=UPI0020401B7B|nr:AraC family ligand binding domain-containing protein [Paenibacillus sp. MER TA 81-3]MCM3342211.1 AraC family ligand binding domain-containing protein [Paenibacillus sp. MER TA 81-3]
MELNRLQIADFLPDRSMAAYEMYLADEVPWHGHEFYECTMIVSGTGKHRLNGEELTLQRGNVFVLTPGVGEPHARHEAGRRQYSAGD